MTDQQRPVTTGAAAARIMLPLAGIRTRTGGAWHRPVGPVLMSILLLLVLCAQSVFAGVNPDLRWDDRFGPGDHGINGPVHAIAVFQGDLYVGGNFSSAGGIAANNLARWDGERWWPVGAGGGNGASAAVLALAVVEDDLYIGGVFRALNGGGVVVEADYVAGWDGSDWFTLGPASGGNGVDSYVYALAASPQGLVVGGNFTQASGVSGVTPANHVVLWDGVDWSALGSGGGNGVNDFVRGLAADVSGIYVGGYFTAANAGVDVPANRVARWNGSAWVALGSGSGNGVDDDVLTLALLDGELYVGGYFIHANVGQPVSTNRVARWNGSVWAALSGGSGGNGVNGIVSTLAAGEGVLHVGGAFSQVDFLGANTPANAIARWDGDGWATLGSGVLGQVWAIGQDLDGDLFAGGAFTHAGGRPSANIARYQALGRLDVVVDGSGDGTVTSDPIGIDCPGDCSQWLHWGTVVTLTAQAAPGSVFLGWGGGDCSGTGTCSVVLEQPTTVEAEFEITHYSLSYSVAGIGGSILGQASQTVAYGGSGTPVTAQADTGYHFTQWSDGRTDNPRVDGNVTAHVAVQAQFALNQYTVTPLVGSGSGTISPGTTQTVAHGHAAVFVFEPAFGQGMGMVAGTCGGTLTGTTFTTAPVTGDCSVQVHFIVVDFGLALDVGRDHVAYGMTVDHVLTLTNYSATSLTGVDIVSILPPQLDPATASWTCVEPAAGVQCTASGAGAINDSGVVVPAGAVARWVLTATVRADAEGAALAYTVNAQSGGGASQEAWEAAMLVLFRNGFNAAGDDGAN